MLTATKVHQGVRKFREAYEGYMTPLSRELGMSQTALDILMFLSNNPTLPTAGDVCQYLRLKPAIVSFHVEKLVQQGLLERLDVPGDRRRRPLAPTASAMELVERGRQMQAEFSQALLQGLEEEELETFARCLDVMSENLLTLTAEKDSTKKE